MDKYLSKLTDRLHMIFFEEENIKDKRLVQKFFVHENGNEFDEKYFELFVELVTFFYAKEHDLRNICDENIPDLLPPIEGEEALFSSFRKYLRSYKGLEVPQKGEVAVEKQDYYNVIHNAIVNKVLIENGFWLNVDSTKIHDKKKENHDIARLFIPVNNSNLYLFSTLFLTKCEEQKIEYNFKVTTDSSKQLGNSIEIDINFNNYKTIMDIISFIIDEYPGLFIDRDKLPIISYPLSDEVGIVPMLFDDTYENKMCKNIVELKNSTRNFGEFRDELNNYINYYLKPLINKLSEEEKNDEKKLH